MVIVVFVCQLIMVCLVVKWRMCDEKINAEREKIMEKMSEFLCYLVWEKYMWEREIMMWIIYNEKMIKTFFY